MTVVDAATLRLEKPVPVGRLPWGIAIQPQFCCGQWRLTFCRLQEADWHSVTSIDWDSGGDGAVPVHLFLDVIEFYEGPSG